MTRLFITLYALVSLVTFGFLFGVNPIVGVSLEKTVAKVSYENFRGTAYLLDQQLQASNNTHQALNQLQALFAFEVSLLPLSNSGLDDFEKTLLSEYKAVQKEIDSADYVFIASQVQTDKLWRLQTDDTQSEQDHNLVIGSALLIEQRLNKVPFEQWQQELSGLQNYFGVPLDLLEKTHSDIVALSQQQKILLQQGRIVGFNGDEPHSIYYYQFKDSPYILKAGPTPEPWFATIIIPIIGVMLAGLLGVAIYLWVYPLWKYLSELKKASVAFGEGDFNARAATAKFSPIHSIAENFNRMAEKVQSLIASHKELTNGVSHELRTPLASMRFSLEMMSSAENKEDRQRYAKEITTDIDELDTLISELLTYARFERSVPTILPSATLLKPWILEQVQRSQKLSHKIVIALSTENINDNDSFLFERRLMGRAVNNILQNAIKYAEEKIHLHCSLKDHRLQITIDDDGPGIPEDKYQDIFSPFSRLDESRDRKTGGFGIGLAIVKQVVDWHHGTIAATQSPLTGARFIIDIPTMKS